MAEDDILEDLEETPSKKGGIVPMLAVLIATLGGGGFVGMNALAPKAGTMLADRASVVAGGGGGDHEGGGGAGGGESALHVVDNLVVNPAASGGGRFLLTSIALQAASVEAIPVLEARDVEIRDAFIMVLGSKTVEELTNIQLRSVISQELLDAVSALVGHNMVHRIFIPQFVIQ